MPNGQASDADYEELVNSLPELVDETLRYLTPERVDEVMRESTEESLAIVREYLGCE
jgi:hypothetical protein